MPAAGGGDPHAFPARLPPEPPPPPQPPAASAAPADAVDADAFDPELHCAAQAASALLDKEYWLRLCPFLSIEGQCMLDACDAEGGDDDDDVDDGGGSESLHAEYRRRMQRDGYFVVDAEDLWPDDASLVRRLRRGVERLEQHGWQASFVAVYDEAWRAAWALQAAVRAGTGGTASFNCDWLGYNIQPPDEAGMPPHRDFAECPDASWYDADGARSLPRIATAWLALGDATPDTSCLYFLPARCDALYRSGQCEEAADVFRKAEAFQNVVAVPLRSGQAVVFSHRVYHWGSAATPNAPHARVSLAMGYSDPAFKPPYLEAHGGECVYEAFPPHSHRLALCAGQMLIYNKRHAGPWPLSHAIQDDYATLRVLHTVLRSHAAVLDQTYLKTVNASPVLPHLAASGGGGEGSDEQEDVPS